MQVIIRLGVLLFLLTTTVAAAQQTDSYALGPGDEVAITVFGEPDLSVAFNVTDDGVLNYPFLGDIQVTGLTVPQLEKRIADGLRGDYLVDPEVTVAVRQYRPFFLNGEVQRPGAFPYQPGLTLEKALALAGGLTPRAARSKIEVKRATDDSGQAVRIRMSDPIMAGDVITVPQSFF